MARSCPRFSCQKIVLSTELKNESGIQTCYFPGTPFLFPSFLPSLPSFFIFLSVFLSPFIASYPPSYPLRSFIFIEVMLIYNIRDVSRVNILFLLRSPPQHAHHPNLVSLCHHQLIPITHVILLLSPSPLATTTLFSVSTCLFSLKQHHFLIIALLMVLMWAFIIEAKTIQSLVYAYLNFLVFLP